MDTFINNMLYEINDIIKPHKDISTNFLGSDISKKQLKQLTALGKGKKIDDPSVRELAFWRWIAFEGYNGLDPRLFKYKQGLLMMNSFAATNWDRNSYRNKHILEVGCGPYGMIEIFPNDSVRIAFDPLNDEYNKLFSNIRSDSINFTADWIKVTAMKEKFDLVICFNVLDHTENPEEILEQMMAALKRGGQFLVQVNTVRDGFIRKQEHKDMHPSPITSEDIQRMLCQYCDKLRCEISNTPSADNEFWFMGWGHKK